MFTRIDPSELVWLRSWLLARHAHYVPDGYKRQVVLLHPDARVDREAEFVPVVGNSRWDGEPAPEQIGALSRALPGHTAPEVRAHAALYDGYPGEAWPPHISEVATFVEDNVTYVLLGGSLHELIHHNWSKERFGCSWVSMLWPVDRAWFLTSDPDSVFTVVACGDDLAETLLSIPEANATEVSDYRWEWAR